jgi:hypothetical protein
MKNKLILITALVSFSVATKVFSFKPDCYAQFESNYASITSSYSSTLTSIYFEAAGVLWMSWRNGDSGTPMGQVSYFMDKIAQAENSYYHSYGEILQQLNECVAKFG